VPVEVAACAIAGSRRRLRKLRLWVGVRAQQGRPVDDAAVDPAGHHRSCCRPPAGHHLGLMQFLPSPWLKRPAGLQ